MTYEVYTDGTVFNTIFGTTTICRLLKNGKWRRRCADKIYCQFGNTACLSDCVTTGIPPTLATLEGPAAYGVSLMNSNEANWRLSILGSNITFLEGQVTTGTGMN